MKENMKKRKREKKKKIKINKKFKTIFKNYI